MNNNVKHKRLLTLIKILLKEDIYHASYIGSVNRSINRLILSLEKDEQNKFHQEIYKITDEMALLADTAIHSHPLKQMSLSRQYSRLQKDLSKIVGKL